MFKKPLFFYSLTALIILSACDSGSETKNVNSADRNVANQLTEESQQNEVAQKQDASLPVLAQGAQWVSGEITVAPGFSIQPFHEGGVKRLRHITISETGDILGASREGYIIGLRDTDNDGRADLVEQREAPIKTGIEIRNGYLYISDFVSVQRIPLDDNLVPQGKFETVISGFPLEQQHADKVFTFDSANNIYVNSGAPSNNCQKDARSLESPGLSPCPQLETHAGIWKFNGNVSGQTMEDGERFVTGVRNANALQWDDKKGGLFIAMHGRDQLFSLWPDLYDVEQSAELPAEEFHFVKGGANLGWPYTYFNPFDNQRYVAPEYGGDGKTISDQDFAHPLYAFPAHWAPNDLLIIDNPAFPAPFNEGIMIAFHGSWNRAPLSQAGYQLSFVPMKNGSMSGKPIDFAVGFSLKENLLSSRDAEHRPVGLALGPDGALFVSDSAQGAVWKITPDL